MAESNTKLTRLEDGRANDKDLPSLLERLATDVAALLDTKLALLKVEIKEEVDAYVRGSLIILAGGIVAAIGFALLNVALAFVVSTFFDQLNISQPAKYALGFVVTGVLYLIIGVVLIVITKSRLARQGILPRRTVAELERDKDWIQNEL